MNLVAPSVADRPVAEAPAAPRPLCHCLRVSAADVQQCIADGDLTTVRSVTQRCGAGGGCTACHRHIKRMIAEHAAETATDRAAECLPACGARPVFA